MLFFPYRVSHYGGHGNKRRYLSADLNVLQMYTMFLSKHYPEYYTEYKAGKDPQKLQCDVKYRYYFNYYKENLNYGFGRPKTDICTVCAESEASIKLSKNMGEKKTLTTKLLLLLLLGYPLRGRWGSMRCCPVASIRCWL